MATFIWPSSPVSITGVATEATLLQVETNTADTVTELQTLNAVDFATETTVATLATEATLSSLNAKVTAVNTGAVTVAASALPTGAATEATLATLATEATLASAASDIADILAKSPSALLTLPYDALEVTSKTANGPTQIVTKVGGLAGTTVQTLDIVYDIDGDFESAVVS